MKIEILKLGLLQTNCYILKKDNKCIIIDPAAEKEKIIKNVDGDKVVGIIVTHSHFDHIGALKDIESYYNIKSLSYNNLEEKEYNIDDFNFEVIYAKGHTMDSIVIYFKEEKIMFVGDFIFKNSIGRTDLGGDIDEYQKSIKKISKYSNIMLYPGHGDITNIDDEKRNNYYFNI